MPDPEAAMIVDRLHPFPQVFPFAAGKLVVLPFGFQDQVRPVVQPPDEIRGILAHGSFVGDMMTKPRWSFFTHAATSGLLSNCHAALSSQPLSTTTWLIWDFRVNSHGLPVYHVRIMPVLQNAIILPNEI
jgi:hypothetical protein